MIKSLISFLLVGLSVTALAQKEEIYLNSLYPSISNAQQIESNISLKNTTEIEAFLQSNFKTNNEYGYKLLSRIESPYGLHYTFIETYLNVEVYQALIKVNTDKSGTVTSIFSSFIEFNEISNEQWPSQNSIVKNLPSIHITHDLKRVWIIHDGVFVRGFLVNYTDGLGYNFEKIINSNSELIVDIERTSHFSANDTIVKAFVYDPDPITTANTIYGGQFVDNADQSNDELNAERKLVDVRVTFDNGVFYTENNYIKIVEISPPTVLPITSTIPEFLFTRSDSGFEDINVVYHITKEQEFIQSLGFTNLVNYQLYADCHGFNGQDNSAFNSATNPPSIIFGEGGVDDAEDADVIVHEYGHAIMHSASPNTNFGPQRNAIDEAFGDYLAASYSKVNYEYRYDYVFNWDGHNVFWDGRIITSTAMYPNDLHFNLYLDAPMWSSALMRIEQNIGRDTTHTVLFQAIYNFSSNMTMAQAAELMIQTDSLVYNGDHYAEICYIFKDKGMISNCSVSRPIDLVSISNLNETSPLTILNSENFALGNGSLEIIALDDFKLDIIDLSGKLILHATSQNAQLNIAPYQLKSGAYLFKISLPDYIETIKIIRY